jgi:hypothetical protein
LLVVMADQSVAGATTLTRDDQIARDRAAFVAGEDIGDEGGDESSKPKPGKVAPKKDDAELDDDERDEASDDADDDSGDADADDDSDDDEDEDDKSDSDDDDEDADDDEDGKQEASDDDDEDEAADSESVKRRRHLQRREERFRLEMTRHRAALEREKQEWQQSKGELATKVQRLEKASSRVRYEPEAVLAELGVTEDDFALVAHRLYALSKEGKADPKRKEAVTQLTKEREIADRLAATEKKNQELEERLKKQGEEQEITREGTKFMRRIVKSVDAESAPLVKRQLERNRAKAEAGLATVAMELAEKHGKVPDVAKVIRIYEKRRREELAELSDTAPAKKDAKAGKKTGKTDAKSEKAKPAPASNRALRDDIVGALEAGDFD